MAIQQISTQSLIVAIHNVTAKPINAIQTKLSKAGYDLTTNIPLDRIEQVFQAMNLKYRFVVKPLQDRKLKESFTCLQYVKHYTSGAHIAITNSGARSMIDGKILDKLTPGQGRIRVIASVMIENAKNKHVLIPDNRPLIVLSQPEKARHKNGPEFDRYSEMKEYVEQNPNATLSDVYAHTEYKPANARWDFTRNHINFQNVNSGTGF